MKKLILWLIICLSVITQVSCGTKTKSLTKQSVVDTGTVVVKNGKGDPDTVNYYCIGCRDNIANMALFQKIVNESTSKTRDALNYPLSFVPTKIEFTVVKEDSLFNFETNHKYDSTYSIISKYSYIGKNGYGNELEGDFYSSFYVKDTNIVNIKEDIKLPNLKYEDGVISRTLVLFDETEQAEIEVFPLRDKNIAVLTGSGCVDDGATLTFKLFDGNEVVLRSWNKFNCEGRSYFRWFTKNQIDKIKASKVRYISFYDDKVLLGYVPKNKTDYLQQLVNMIE